MTYCKRELWYYITGDSVEKEINWFNEKEKAINCLKKNYTEGGELSKVIGKLTIISDSDIYIMEVDA